MIEAVHRHTRVHDTFIKKWRLLTIKGIFRGARRDSESEPCCRPHVNSEQYSVNKQKKEESRDVPCQHRTEDTPRPCVQETDGAFGLKELLT
jgi:hypothetical protein